MFKKFSNFITDKKYLCGTKYLKINGIIFLLTLVLGLLYVKYSLPEPKIITRHLKDLRPDKEDNTIYHEEDDHTKCYKYRADEIQCPINNDLIIEHPVTIKS